MIAEESNSIKACEGREKMHECGWFLFARRRRERMETNGGLLVGGE